MIRSLLGKELAEHWASMVLIALFMCFGFVAIFLMVVFATDGGRPLDALRAFLLTFVLLTSLILGNRLVVKEYQSQTQLFLEALPMTRLGMITTKYVFGLVVVMVPTLLMFGFATVMSLRIDDLTRRFFEILLSKTVVFTTLVYTFFFLMGLLGRYRIAIYILLLVLAMMLEAFTNLEINRFGPIALMDNRFSYERNIFPALELTVCIGIIIVSVFLIGFLTVVREGNVAAMLAEKMSYREKIFISCLILGMLACFSVLDERVIKQPFDLPDALVNSNGITDVKITSPNIEKQERAQQLVDTVAAEVSALVDYFEVDKLPPIFLVHRSDLDANQFERGELVNAEGILVRANFYHQDWREHEFLPWFAAELINASSSDRVKAEPIRWVIDGFPFFWAGKRGYEYDGADSKQRDVRVAYAYQQNFSKHDYDHWLTYRERVGRDIAQAMAWNGLEAIKSVAGEKATRRFLRRILDPDVPADIRATIHLYSNSIRRVAAQELDLTESQIFEHWITRAQNVEQTNKISLKEIPKPTGSIVYEKITSGSRQVNFKFDCSPSPRDEFFSVKYSELSMFDYEMAESDESEEEFSFETHRESSLTATFARRSKFMYTFAVYSDVMGCDVITGWQREVMP